MPDPLDKEFTQQNPIVAAATRIRARREIERAASAADSGPVPFEDAEQALTAFGERLAAGAKRLNAILGRERVKFIKLLRPLRLRVRFSEKRVSLDLDEVHQLVRVSGIGLDGEWQFDPGAQVPSLINLSKISTEADYGKALTASSLLQLLAADETLEPPPHLQGPGPLSF